MTQIDAEFNWLSDDQILATLESSNYPPAALSYIKKIVMLRFVTRAIGASTSNSSPEFVLAQISDQESKIKPIVVFIDSKLSQKHALLSELMTEKIFQCFDVVKRELPDLLLETNDDATERFINKNAKKDPLLRNLAGLLKAYNEGAITNGLWNNSKLRWWDTEYLIWFSAWSATAVQDIQAHNYPWIPRSTPLNFSVNMPELLSKYGTEYFTEDPEKRTFVPGLFLLALYEETFKIGEPEKLKDDFYEQTLIPFDIYVTKFYPPN